MRFFAGRATCSIVILTRFVAVIATQCTGDAQCAASTFCVGGICEDCSKCACSSAVRTCSTRCEGLQDTSTIINLSSETVASFWFCIVFVSIICLGPFVDNALSVFKEKDPKEGPSTNARANDEQAEIQSKPQPMDDDMSSASLFAMGQRGEGYRLRVHLVDDSNNNLLDVTELRVGGKTSTVSTLRKRFIEAIGIVQKKKQKMIEKEHVEVHHKSSTTDSKTKITPTETAKGSKVRVAESTSSPPEKAQSPFAKYKEQLKKVLLGDDFLIVQRGAESTKNPETDIPEEKWVFKKSEKRRRFCRRPLSNQKAMRESLLSVFDGVPQVKMIEFFIPVKFKMDSGFHEYPDAHELDDSLKFWALPTETDTLDTHYNEFYGKMSSISIETVQTIMVFVTFLIAFIVHFLAIIPATHCFMVATITSAAFVLVLEVAACFCGKGVRAIASKMHRWLTGLLFLSFCIFIVVFTSASEDVVMDRGSSETFYEIRADGCEINLNGGLSTQVKLKVSTAAGTALTTKAFQTTQSGEVTRIQVVDSPEYKLLVNAYLAEQGLSADDTLPNSTESVVDIVSEKFGRRCEINVEVSTGSRVSILVVQPYVRFKTILRNPSKSVIVLNKLQIRAKKTIDLRLNTVILSELRVNSTYGNVELYKSTIAQSTLNIEQLYGSAELRLPQGTISSLVNFSNSQRNTVCLRSGGWINQVSDGVFRLNPSKNAFSTSDPEASFIISNARGGHFVVTTLDGVCGTAPQTFCGNGTGPQTPRFLTNSLEKDVETTDLVEVRMFGFGNRHGSWTFSKNEAYNYFSSIYISAFSFGMLTPSVKSTTLILTPSYWSNPSFLSLDNRAVKVAKLLRDTTETAPPSLKISMEDDESRMYQIPPKQRLSMGGTIAPRQWSEASSGVLAVGILTTFLLAVLVHWLGKVIFRNLYKKRVRQLAEQFARKRVPYSSRNEEFVLRERAFLVHQLMPKLDYMHVLQMEMVLYTEKQRQKHENEMGEEQEGENHVFGTYEKRVKEKIKRIVHNLAESACMALVVCGPVIPMIIVSYAYKSLYLHGGYRKKPMDAEMIVFAEFVLGIALLGLFSNFRIYYKMITGVSAAVTTRSDTEGSSVSGHKQRSTTACTTCKQWWLTFFDTIQDVALETCRFLSTMIVAHAFVWVLLGIVLKPETAIPTIAAIGGLCWHCYTYSKKLEAFQAKIFKSLEEAFQKARTELEQSELKNLMKQLQDGARKFQIPLSQIERLEQAMALISDGIMSPPMYLLNLDDGSVEPYLLEILTHLDLEEHEWKEILNEEKDTLLKMHVKEAFPDDNLTDAEHGTKKIVKEIRQTLTLYKKGIYRANQLAELTGLNLPWEQHSESIKIDEEEVFVYKKKDVKGCCSVAFEKNAAASNGGSASAGDESNVLKVGKQIKAKLPNWSKPSGGEILGVNKDGTVHVKFEDGDEMKYLQKKWIVGGDKMVVQQAQGAGANLNDSKWKWVDTHLQKTLAKKLKVIAPPFASRRDRHGASDAQKKYADKILTEIYKTDIYNDQQNEVLKGILENIYLADKVSENPMFKTFYEKWKTWKDFCEGFIIDLAESDAHLRKAKEAIKGSQQVAEKIEELKNKNKILTEKKEECIDQDKGSEEFDKIERELKEVQDNLKAEIDREKADKKLAHNTYAKASEKHQEDFKELLKFAVNHKRNTSNDKYTSAGAKDAIAEVLEKNGITHRTILMWLVLSVLIIVLTFVLINFAQLAFAAPGLVSSSLSAILCASSSFGVNKSFEKHSTSEKKSSATTKHAGDDLKRHWQTKGSENFTKSLENQIEGAVLKQQQNFDELIQRVEQDVESVKISINEKVDTSYQNLCEENASHFRQTKDELKENKDSLEEKFKSLKKEQEEIFDLVKNPPLPKSDEHIAQEQKDNFEDYKKKRKQKQEKEKEEEQKRLKEIADREKEEIKKRMEAKEKIKTHKKDQRILTNAKDKILKNQAAVEARLKEKEKNIVKKIKSRITAATDKVKNALIDSLKNGALYFSHDHEHARRPNDDLSAEALKQTKEYHRNSSLDKTPENPDCAVCNAQFNAAKDNGKTNCIEDKLTMLEKRNCCGFRTIVDNKEMFFHFQSFPFLSSLWMHVEHAKTTYAELQFRTEDASHQTYIDEYHKMLINAKVLEKSRYLEWGSSSYLQGDEEHIFVRSTTGDTSKLKKVTKTEFAKNRKKLTKKMSLKDKKLQRQNSYSKRRERKTRKKTQTSMVCAGCNTTLINLGTYVKRQSTAESLKARLEGQNNKVEGASEELKKIVEIKKTLGDKQGEEEALSELALLDSIGNSKDISTELQRLVKRDKERESFTYVKSNGCIHKAGLGKNQREAYEFVEKECKTSIMGGTWQMTVIDDSGSEKTVDLPKKCIDCQCCSIEIELLNPLLKLIFKNKDYNIALHADQPLEPTPEIRKILERRKDTRKVPHVPEWALWLEITEKQRGLVEQIKKANEQIRIFNKKEDKAKLTKDFENTIGGLEKKLEGLEKELENTITVEQTRLYDEVNAIISHQVLKVSSVNKHVHKIVNQIRDEHLMKNLKSAIKAATGFMKLMEECGSKEISKILERSKYVDKTLLNSNWLFHSKKDDAHKNIAASGLVKLQDYVEEHIVFIGEAESLNRKNKFDEWVKQNFSQERHEMPEGILDQQYSFENCIQKFTSKDLTKSMMSDEGDDVLTSRAFFTMKLADARMRVNIREHNGEIEKIDVFKDKWKNRLRLICSFCALFGINFEIESKHFLDAESMGEGGEKVKNAIATLGKYNKKWDGKREGDEGSWTKFKFHVFKFEKRDKRTLNSKFFMRINELMDQLHDIPLDKQRIAGIPYNSVADSGRVKAEFGDPRRIAAIEVINIEGVLSGLRVYFEYNSATDSKKSDLDNFFQQLEFKEKSIVCFEGVMARNMRIMKPDGTFDAFDTNAKYSKLVYIGTRSENRGYFRVPEKRTLQFGTVWQSKTTGQVSGQDAIVGTKQKRVVGTNKKTEDKIDCRVLEFELVDESASIQWEPIYEEDEMDIGELMLINKTPFTSTSITRDMINVSKSLLPELSDLFDEEQTAKKDEERNIESVNETDTSLDMNKFIILHRWLSAYIYKLFGELRKAENDEFIMYQQHR